MESSVAAAGLTLCDETLVVSRFRENGVWNHCPEPLVFEPGEQVVLGHIDPDMVWTYAGCRDGAAVDRDGACLLFTTQSDRPVTAVLLTPWEFHAAFGDGIWFA